MQYVLLFLTVGLALTAVLGFMVVRDLSFLMANFTNVVYVVFCILVIMAYVGLGYSSVVVTHYSSYNWLSLLIAYLVLVVVFAFEAMIALTGVYLLITRMQ